jgi:signal recognition particle subunit SRP54
MRSLDASQQVVRIVRDEMVALFGNAEGGLNRRRSGRASSCCSGFGCWQTTTAGKLGMAGEARPPSVLVSTASSAGGHPANIVGTKSRAARANPAEDGLTRAKGAITAANNLGFDVVIVDAAGRLRRRLTNELVAIRHADPATGCSSRTR